MKKRSTLEVDLRDIPTKSIDEEKEGFYLFVHGCVNEALQGVSMEDGSVVVKSFKKNTDAKYHFPLIKRDLAMLVFCGLYELSSEPAKKDCNSYEYRCVVKQFIPFTESYIMADEITSVSMFLCSGGKISEVIYDPNYQVKEYEEIRQQEIKTNKYFKDTDTTISSYVDNYN